MAKKPKNPTNDCSHIHWVDDESYVCDEFEANWARQLIAEARAGNVHAGEHLLIAAYVRLRRSEPHSPLTGWFGDFIVRAAENHDASFAQLVAPMPKGGRRPTFPNDLKLRIHHRVEAGIRNGMNVKEAIIGAFEKLQSINRYHSKTRRPLTLQMVHKWYYEERRRRRSGPTTND